ncbi:MAG: hypothetical protein JKY01_02775 [Pseudomonadales bacterium]|nr:hypothetical protein [Pseudomonadales bacterium]
MFKKYMLFIISFLIAPPLSASETTQTNIAKNSPQPELLTDYQNLIKALKNSDSVIPPKPITHPVKAMYNREAIIPPMCYTKTEGKHNPCYVCHQNPIEGRENTMGDGGLQVAYSFSDQGTVNHWKNLFEDRSERIAEITDKEILQWVREDNYSELAGRLKQTEFKGWVPDLKNLQDGPVAFGKNGLAKDGSHWVAFNYKPFPSTFWPTNGSTDDVMIRLGKDYRSDSSGNYSEQIYRANLAIVEANIKNLKEISTQDLDENLLQADLNKDGVMNTINNITVLDSYVGAAKTHFLQASTYPEKTEFLHTVRYLDIDNNGEVTFSRRMKEVRYMKKWVNYPLISLRENYREEAYAKDDGYLPGYSNLHDNGLDNGSGWSVQGFIEDKTGRLRTYTYEENFSCMGCHSSIGSTIDKTFSFPRKIDGALGWAYLNLRGMPDAPNMGEQKGEILTYLERAAGGSEFRNNPEMKKRWFKNNGQINTKKVQHAKDVYTLITPSKKRALLLNKSYRVIVEDQDYIFGRDASARPPINVYKDIDNKTAPTLPKEIFYKWDIRLDWSQQ